MNGINNKYFHRGLPQGFFKCHKETVLLPTGDILKKISSLDEIELLESVEESLDRRDIILVRDDASSLSLPHFLSVKVQVDDNKSGLKPSKVLWLDGGKFFNPYEISEAARSLGESPKKVLGNIQIARAFTPYQMISLISEKMWEVLNECKARLVVITGLLSLFLDSDLSGSELEGAFEFILNELEEFRNREEILLLKENLPGVKTDCEALLRLRKIADVIFDSNGRGHGNVVKGGKHFEKPILKTPLKPPSSKTVSLEKYLRRD